MKKITEYKISGLTIYLEECAGHHIARATLEAGRRVDDTVNREVTYYEEDIVGEGITKRSGSDRRDDYVGQNLAVGRALEVLAEKVLRRARGKVKHNDDMKLQRAHKRDYAEYLKISEEEKEVVPYRPDASKNMSTVSQAISEGLGIDPAYGHDHMAICDDLFKESVKRITDGVEDTHFEDSEEERLVDEC